MQSLTKEQIENSFSDSDHRVLHLPSDLLEDVDFAELDYFGWKDPSGHFGYVVVEHDGALQGLVFRMHPGEPTASTGMCNLCLSVHNHGTKAISIQSRTKPNQSIGIHVCRELNCSHMVRGKMPGILMGETISVGKKIERLQVNLSRFVGRVLEGRPGESVS